MPTVRKMCQQLDVSVATLDDALRVLEDQGVITRRQGSGIYVSDLVFHKTIGLVFGCNIFDGVVSPFYTLLLEHCQQRAMMYRERFRFFLDVPQIQGIEQGIPVHKDLEDAVIRGQLDGVMMAAHRQDKKEWLIDHGVPVVELGGEEPVCSQGESYKRIVEMGVAELIQQGKKRIAMVTPLGETRCGNQPDFQLDITTFQQVMRKSGLSVHDKLVWQNLHQADAMGKTQPRGDQGWQAMHDLWSQPKSQRPDAILVLDDMLTLGMLSAMPVLGIALNRDITIATHANAGSPALRNYEDHLIRLEIDPSEFIDAMFARLHAIFESKPMPSQISPMPQLRVPDLISC